jgi:hypothetical protein
LKNSNWSGLNFHKDNKIMFIILYKHYLPKNSELQKPIVQVKIQMVSPNFGAYTLGAYGPWGYNLQLGDPPGEYLYAMPCSDFFCEWNWRAP